VGGSEAYPRRPKQRNRRSGERPGTDLTGYTGRASGERLEAGDCTETNRSYTGAPGLKPSAHGEFEITDLNNVYLERGMLTVERLGCGCAWFDTGTHESLLEAAEFVRTIEMRQGLKIACVEEVAYHMGYIDRERLLVLARHLGKSEYRRYLEGLLDDAL
jgi:hypothetical protein